MKVGFIKNNSSFVEFNLDQSTQEITEVVSDLNNLTQSHLKLLIFDDTDESIESILPLLQKESPYAPLIAKSALKIELEALRAMDYANMFSLVNRVSKSWVLSNNLSLISQMYSTTNHLKDLWINDRNAFFEELWFCLRSNLGSRSLDIIFHDLKEPSEKQKDKGAKAELMYAVVKGEKRQQIFEAKEQESKLMQEYKNEFNSSFEVSEFSKNKGELVMTSKIKLSPILILAKTDDFTPLQQSLIKGLLDGIAS